jgi:uridine kinase/tRNA A-37 threonylcarbamoyl transferase component Bud32
MVADKSFETPWVRDRFPIRSQSDQIIVRSAPNCGNLAAHLVSVRDWTGFWNSLPTAAADEDIIDSEDERRVKLFGPLRGVVPSGLVLKRVRDDRVPSADHEPRIADVLRTRGVHAPEYVAMCQVRDSHSPFSVLVSRFIQNSASLASLYARPSIYRRLSQRVERQTPHLDDLPFYFGAAVFDLFASGIIHAELDLKNVVLQVDSPLRFFFIDFERTRESNSPPTLDKVASAFRESVPRRLARLSPPRHLVEHFVAGYLSRRGTVTAADIAEAIKLIAGRSSRPTTVIAIDGFAGAGKTLLATTLAASLDDFAIIETDWFIRYTRAERNSMDVRVRHREWYGLKRLRTLLERVHRISSPETLYIDNLYDHDTGRMTLGAQLQLRPGSVILIEGMYSLAEDIGDLVDFGLILTASQETLMGRVLKRDVVTRGIPQQAVAGRFRDINLGPYLAHHYQQSAAAHVVLSTDYTRTGTYRVARIQPGVLQFFLLPSSAQPKGLAAEISK